MFEGHKLCRIDNTWVFDLTEFVGYRILIEDEKVVGYKKVFVVKMDRDYSSFEFEKMGTVHFGVMRKTKKLIQQYFREAFICLA